MPIAHQDMTDGQRSEVAAKMLNTLGRVGEPKYDRTGEDDGFTLPIVAGTIRHSRSGAPWVTFGEDVWWQYRDTAEWRIVLDADGRPLGVADEGPLVIGDVHGTPCAVTVDTGRSREDNILWT